MTEPKEKIYIGILIVLIMIVVAVVTWGETRSYYKKEVEPADIVECEVLLRKDACEKAGGQYGVRYHEIFKEERDYCI